MGCRRRSTTAVPMPPPAMSTPAAEAITTSLVSQPDDVAAGEGRNWFPLEAPAAARSAPLRS